jgi:holin-like protein
VTPFAILLGFDLLGLIVQHVGFPLPANVTGLLLLAGALFAGLVKVEQVRPASDVLLRHLVLFFAPVIAAVVTFGPVLRHEWPAIAGGMVASTFIATLVAGVVTGRFIK